MKICSKCSKRIWFWNRFNKKYGEGWLLDKNYRLIEKVRFCSKECAMKYKPKDLIKFTNNVPEVEVWLNIFQQNQKEEEKMNKYQLENEANKLRLNEIAEKYCISLKSEQSQSELTKENNQKQENSA
jgi:hypothetical protein